MSKLKIELVPVHATYRYSYLDCLPVVEESFQGAPAELGRLEVVLGHVGVGQVGRGLGRAYPG